MVILKRSGAPHPRRGWCSLMAILECHHHHLRSALQRIGQHKVYACYLSEGRKQVQKARPSGDALPSGSFTSGASFGKTQLAGNTWNTSVIRRKRIHDGDPRSPFKRLPEVGDWLCQSPPQVTIPSPLPSAPLCPSSRRTSFGGRRVTV